jgi:hypothetical protein
MAKKIKSLRLLLLFRGGQSAAAGKGTVPPLTYRKTAVFPDFANKGFGGLGLLSAGRSTAEKADQNEFGTTLMLSWLCANWL